jgi:hypothetical protein
MVDTVLAEQNSLETEDKQTLKSNRRRINRPNRNQKENSAPIDRKAGRTERSEIPQSRSQNQNPRNRAPRVGHANGDIKEKADYTDGILRLKISNARPRTVYTRLVRLMLAGFDGSGNPLQTTKPIEKIEVSALGNAIVSAIFVVDNLIKGKVVEQISMAGDFITVGEQPSEGRSRGTARLHIDLKRVTGWDAKDDDVLRKTRVYRTKVLGLPEDA